MTNANDPQFWLCRILSLFGNGYRNEAEWCSRHGAFYFLSVVIGADSSGSNTCFWRNRWCAWDSRLHFLNFILTEREREGREEGGRETRTLMCCSTDSCLIGRLLCVPWPWWIRTALSPTERTRPGHLQLTCVKNRKFKSLAPITIEKYFLLLKRTL